MNKRMSKNRILVFIPTYNEKENVESLCKQILAFSLNADLLFMDDNSPDGTGRILDRLSEGLYPVSVIHRNEKKGIGSAHKEGIIYAYKHGYETLITMDCDFTHKPADIPRLLLDSRENPVTVGSRFLMKNGLREWNHFRRFMTHIGNFLTKRLLGIKADASGAFRLYRLNLIPLSLFEAVESKGYSFFFESLFLLMMNGYSIQEIPIELPARTYGHSKMSLYEIWRSVTFLIKLSVEKYINPERFRFSKEIDSRPIRSNDPQEWDNYWRKKKKISKSAFDFIASFYRRVIIKRNLKKALFENFSEGSKLLHGGCGSGEVDTDIHDYFRITAVDISTEGLKRYLKNNPNAECIEQTSIFNLPFDDNAFDGVYNLGVLEHFTHDDIKKILWEFSRVLKPGGKLVFFWPHRFASSVLVLKTVHFIFKLFPNHNKKFHPPEISLLRSKSDVNKLFKMCNLDYVSYSFGPKDLFVQAVIVGRKY